MQVMRNDVDGAWMGQGGAFCMVLQYILGMLFPCNCQVDAPVHQAVVVV